MFVFFLFFSFPRFFFFLFLERQRQRKKKEWWNDIKPLETSIIIQKIIIRLVRSFISTLQLYARPIYSIWLNLTPIFDRFKNAFNVRSGRKASTGIYEDNWKEEKNGRDREGELKKERKRERDDWGQFAERRSALIFRNSIWRM